MWKFSRITEPNGIYDFRETFINFTLNIPYVFDFSLYLWFLFQECLPLASSPPLPTSIHSAILKINHKETLQRIRPSCQSNDQKSYHWWTKSFDPKMSVSWLLKNSSKGDKTGQKTLWWSTANILDVMIPVALSWSYWNGTSSAKRFRRNFEIIG